MHLLQENFEKLLQMIKISMKASKNTVKRKLIDFVSLTLVKLGIFVWLVYKTGQSKKKTKTKHNTCHVNLLQYWPYKLATKDKKKPGQYCSRILTVTVKLGDTVHPQGTADFVRFTEEILHEKLHFLFSETYTVPWDTY